MEVINPNEIGSKISTLISEAREKFVAISPYIDIKTWKKIITNIERAVKRGVKVEVYYRDINDRRDYDMLLKLGVYLYQINGLHTKMYFNEKQMIVTSMNFYEYSDLNTKEIGILYDDQSSYGKLLIYFQQHICLFEDETSMSQRTVYQQRSALYDFLSAELLDERIHLNEDKIYCSTVLKPFAVKIFYDRINIVGHDYLDKGIVRRMSKALKKGASKFDVISSINEWTIIINHTEMEDILAIIKDIRGYGIS